MPFFFLTQLVSSSVCLFLFFKPNMEVFMKPKLIFDVSLQTGSNTICRERLAPPLQSSEFRLFWFFLMSVSNICALLSGYGFSMTVFFK